MLPEPDREHILSMDCWCKPSMQHYGRATPLPDPVASFDAEGEEEDDDGE